MDLRVRSLPVRARNSGARIARLFMASRAVTRAYGAVDACGRGCRAVGLYLAHAEANQPTKRIVQVIGYAPSEARRLFAAIEERREDGRYDIWISGLAAHAFGDVA
jgi:hypothetical protein